MAVTHLTERGALLARLEHRCERSGLWYIEGLRLQRLGLSDRWWLDGRWRFRSFTAALRFIADRIDQETT